jgi:hypothetical protein
VQLAAFADFGWLQRRQPLAGGATPGPEAERDLPAASVLTPGAGVRILSPMGPIRLDLGYDPRGPRRHPVFTQAADGRAVRVGTGLFDPFTHDDPGAFREFVRRLQLQLAVGQPF